MVAAVRCPNPKCRKFMLVEETDQGTVVPCLICKQPIKVPAAGNRTAPATPPAPAPAAPVPPVAAAAAPGEDLTPIFDDEDQSEPQFKMD